MRKAETGFPNADQGIYREIAEQVKKRCDIILCFTTDGRLGEPVENKVRSCLLPAGEEAILAIHPRSSERGILAFSRKGVVRAKRG